MQTLKLIQHPHLLYTGANGRKTFGISVERLDMTKEDERKSGYQFDFNINDYSFFKYQKDELMEKLGITEVEYNQLVSEFQQLEQENDVCQKQL